MGSSYWLFLFATFLSPFYFFKSGVPQIADYIYTLSLLPLYLNYKKTIFLINLHLKELIFFLVWIIFNSIIWSIYLSDINFLISPTFYTFNFCISSIFILYGTKYPEKFFLQFKNMLFFNNLIIISFLIFLPNITSRSTGSFNNPNQFAIYGLFLMSTIQYLNDFNIPKNLKDFSIYMSGLIFIISSFSIAANSMLPVFFILNLSKLKFKVINIAICLILIIVPFSILYNSTTLKSNLNTRIFLIESKTTNFIQERSYDRILEYPSYLFFGAGEGKYTRFTQDINSRNEIHSTVANIIFSYGLIGLVLFLSLLYKLFKPFNLNEIVLAFPIFFFSLFHMTLRSTFIWLFLSLFIIKKNLLSKV